MTNSTTEMAEKTAQNDAEHGSSSDTIALDRRYRQIGISAVAAAVRYQGIAKNPAYAPVPTRWRDVSEEAAA